MKVKCVDGYADVDRIIVRDEDVAFEWYGGIIEAKEVLAVYPETPDDVECENIDYESGTIKWTEEVDGVKADFELSVNIFGKFYHYSGRNSYGEWVEPEENGFQCTGLTLNEAYVYIEGFEMKVEIANVNDFMDEFSCEY